MGDRIENTDFIARQLNAAAKGGGIDVGPYAAVALPVESLVQAIRENDAAGHEALADVFKQLDPDGLRLVALFALDVLAKETYWEPLEEIETDEDAEADQ